MPILKRLPAISFSIILLFTISCTNQVSEDYCPAGYSPDETFDEADRPGLEYNAADDYFLVRPWNYDKNYNAARKYPLLIYLHGSSQTKYLKNLYYMGMGYYTWSDAEQNFTEEYRKDVADKFRKTYPCFMFVPQGPSGWDTATLIAQIQQLKTDYRIDVDRIYIHGFSMGGGAIYPLAEAYYEYNGQLFAAMIRLNGYSPVSLSDVIVENTSIWLMVGLGDTQSVIDNVRNAYEFLKDHDFNSGAAVSEELNYIIGEKPYQHLANTVTLEKRGIKFARETEYPDDGHFITEFPFSDPDVFSWMFCQSVGSR